MIDSHAHVGFSTFDEDREEVIKRMESAGVTGWIEIGTTIEDSKQSLKLVSGYDNAWSTVGIHPSDLGPEGDPDADLSTGSDEVGVISEVQWSEVRRLLDEEKVVAVGEVGFDFFHDWKGYSEDQQHELQAKVLKEFIEVAIEKSLSMVFHVRSSETLDAHDALIQLLKDLPDRDGLRGVIHTFSGTAIQAEEYLKLGMYLSISGVVTFKNAGEIAEIAKEMPLDRMLIETDSPFLTPDPYRGQRNEPSYVSLVAEKIAELRGVEVGEVDEVTTRNTEKLFRV